ncbi:MAG: radical SAM protein, partial [Candidatus Limnocylindria bacterium]
MTVMASPAFDLRLERFGTGIDLFAPALKPYRTSEFVPVNPRAFVPLSVTGGACALQCEHCAAKVIKPMVSVTAGPGLYETAAALAQSGTRGVLVSG